MPSILDNSRRRDSLEPPPSFHVLKASIISTTPASPSPRKKASKKSATGSGLNTPGDKGPLCGHIFHAIQDVVEDLEPQVRHSYLIGVRKDEGHLCPDL